MKSTKKIEEFSSSTSRSKYARPYFEFKAGETIHLSENPDLTEAREVVVIEDGTIPFYSDFFYTKRLRCQLLETKEDLLLDNASDHILGYIVEAVRSLTDEEIKTGQAYHTQMKRIRDKHSIKHFDSYDTLDGVVHI